MSLYESEQDGLFLMEDGKQADDIPNEEWYRSVWQFAILEVLLLRCCNVRKS